MSPALYVCASRDRESVQFCRKQDIFVLPCSFAAMTSTGATEALQEVRRIALRLTHT